MPSFTRGACLFALTWLAPAASSPGMAQPTPGFEDRSMAAGLEVVAVSGSAEKPHILESTGNGVLVLDYDGDGYQDLFFVSAMRLPSQPGAAAARSTLVRNRGDGTFEDVSERAGVGAVAFAQGGAVGDVDGDGWPDLYVTAFGPNLLFRNQGDGSFREVGESMGLADARWGIGASFFDGDGDGDQDLFVANYIEATWDDVRAARRTRLWRGKVAVMDGPRGLPESANAYYRNRGDGTFEDATAAAGFDAGGMGYSMAVTSLDYDNDGDIDLYLANDSTPNRLYRNLGAGTFEEVGTVAGVAYDGDGSLQGSMGAGAGDYDGDGWLDLAVTNFAHDHYTVYRNAGGEYFLDESFGTRVALSTYAPLGWAALFFDADNDADLDLFFSNGHIYPQVDEDPSLGESFRQTNQLLLDEGGVFRDVSAEAGAGFAIRKSSRGAATIDYDNDGDLDLVVSNQDEAADLLRNELAGDRHWLLVDLRPSGGPNPVLGARLELLGCARAQIRETTSASGYASHSDARAHFGLAGQVSARQLRVRWPSGRRVTYLGLPADRIYVLAAPGESSPSGKGARGGA